MSTRLASHRSKTLFTVSDFLDHLLKQYGYGVLGVTVMFESMGIPLPAESLIIAASLYAGSTHQLNIGWIALSSIIGAIMGDNFGYLIGRKFGYKLLQKHGGKVGLTKERLLLGQYLFRRHGGVVVFAGRFAAILRVFVALLAGAIHMPWKSFLFYNAIGGIVWGGGYAIVSYLIGKQIEKITGPIGLVLAVIGIACVATLFYFLKKNEKRLTEQALASAKEEENRKSRRSKRRQVRDGR